MEEPQVKIAIVGMAGSGKTVLTTVLAIRISQQADQGMFLTPVGENLRQTLKYVQQNWQTLQNGQWPPSTPAGEVANLKWNLITGSDTATVRFADCAGQDIHAIFSSDNFNPDLFPENQRQLFSYLNSANILLILVNMEDLLGRGSSQALENALDLYQMIYVLSQETEVPRKIAVIFSQYDRYRAEVDQLYNGNLIEYFRANLPQVYSEYIRTKSFEIFPVAAVEQTQKITDDNGNVVAVPQRGFSSYNIEKLIQWITSGIAELSLPLKVKGETKEPSHPSGGVALPSLAVPTNVSAVSSGYMASPTEFNPNPKQYEVFWEQKGITRNIALSRDGKYLAVTCYNVIKILEFSTGKVLQTIQGHTSSISSVSYSLDGQFLASGSLDNTVHIWNVQTGECLKTLKGHTGTITSVSYSPDGRFIASGSGDYYSRDNTVRIWNAQTGESIKTLKGHTESVLSMSYSPDGRFIASGSGEFDGDDNTVRIWNVQTGERVKTLEHEDSVFSVSYSPDGRFLASGSNDDTVRIWNSQTGECVKTLKGDTESVLSVSYSPDGLFLASGNLDGTVRIWNVQTGECVKTLKGHTGYVNSVSYSPDENYLSVGAKNGLTVWRVAE